MTGVQLLHQCFAHIEIVKVNVQVMLQKRLLDFLINRLGKQPLNPLAGKQLPQLGAVFQAERNENHVGKVFFTPDYFDDILNIFP